MNKTRFPCVFIMIPAWQTHANLSMISKSTNNCEGQVTTGTLTVGVDKLEKLGLVQRKPHEKDRRSWLIVLTDQGKKMYEQHHKYHQDFTNEISRDLTLDQIDTLTDHLDIMLKRL